MPSSHDGDVENQVEASGVASPPTPSQDGASGAPDHRAPEEHDTLSIRQTLWPILLSLLALGAVGYFTFEPGIFWEFARSVNPLLLTAAVLTTALRVFFGGWRFAYVSRGRLNLAEGTRGQLAWDFLSNITPTAVGGGPIAPVYIARDRGITFGEASAFTLFCMVLDQLFFALLAPLVLLASAFFNVFPGAVGGIGWWTFALYFAGLLAWALLFSYTVLLRPDLLRRAVGWIFSFGPLQRFRRRAVREMTRLAERARRLRSEPAGFYLKSSLLTAGFWIGRYALIVLVIWSVYPALEVWTAFLRSAALTLCGLALPTPGGAGGFEGLYALFFGPLIPEALVAPTLLLWRILGYYIFLALGLYLFAHQMQQAHHREENKADPPMPKPQP